MGYGAPLKNIFYCKKNYVAAARCRGVRRRVRRRVWCCYLQKYMLYPGAYSQAIYSSFFPSPPYLTTISFNNNFSDKRNLIAVVIL